MAGSSPAPGYATPEQLAATPDARAGLPLARFLCFGFAVAVAALEQGVVRQPAAYLLPGSWPSLGATRALGSLALVLGASWAWRRRTDFGGLSWAIAALTALLACAGPAWFWSFDRGRAASAVALTLPFATASLVGSALASAVRVLSGAARSLEVLRYVLEPFRVLLALLFLLAYVSLSGRLGLWRSSALLALAVAGIGAVLPSVQRYLYGARARSRSGALASIGLALGVVSLGFAQRALPIEELTRYPGEVVFSSQGPGRYVVSSVQQSFEVYRGSVLRLASVDAKRYAECLVHPALALARSRRNVLVLGTGDGLAEREILTYADVEKVTTLGDDLSLTQLARGNDLFRELSAHAMDSPRVSVIQAEALPWLAHHAARFDVIVVDLPDPSDFSQGKNYTRYFYQQLRAHLVPSGIFVTQATSSAASPSSFSSIAATVAAAGFRADGYAAAIPTLGEWAFVLGSERDVLAGPRSPVAIRALLGTRYVSERRLELMLSSPPGRDTRAPVNTLAEQPLVELLNEERRARGL